MKRFLFFCVLAIFSLSISVCASSKLSPAIDVIAEDSGMVKAGIINDGRLLFSAYDFDEALGTSINSIRIVSLPDSSTGRLMLDDLYVVKNQVIDRKALSSLRFVPKNDEEAECVFSFIPSSGNYEIECTLKVLEETNYVPIATNGSAISTWTNKDISCFGVLNGSDPEGDSLRFEIVSYPEKGLVQIVNAETGDYKYTPYEGAKGKDSFTYRVRDSYGNYSAESTVNIKIEKAKTTLVFEDMNGHRAHNAVLEVGSEYMSCVKNENGTYSFNPNGTVTTEEFLSLVMNVMGAKDVPKLEKTRFADDAEISNDYKGYFESAFALGIISGERKADGIYVNPKKEITTAEAAVIINKIIGAKSNASLGVFADEGEIPDWAKSAIVSLTELGILKRENGKINPNSPLTRAQTAQILMSLLEYRGKLNH